MCRIERRHRKLLAHDNRARVRPLIDVMRASAEVLRDNRGSQGSYETMGDYEMFPSEEAITRAGGDRPTPIFHAPSQLRHFDEVMSVPPAPVEAAPTTSQPYLTAVSMEPGAAEELVNQVAAEDEFWQSAPRYSTTSVRPLSLSPPAQARPEPSRVRRFAVKALFIGLFSGVLALLAYEVSVLTDAGVEDLQAEVTNLQAEVTNLAAR